MNITEIAQKYIDAGLSILPIKQDKSPAAPKWKDVKFKASDFMNAQGIGVICGQGSNNLECFDFDNHFGDAKRNLTNFVKEISFYKDYNFIIQSTQNGGYHLIYRCDKVGGNQKLASKPKLQNNKWKPDAIIETRGEGGYFAAFPTKGYKVLRGNFNEIPKITTQQREDLIEIAKSFNEWSEPVKSDFENKERPGDYFNSLSEAKQIMIEELRNSNWKQKNSYAWQRPEKQKGISATLGKVAENVFYVFSSNAHPFESESGYTPFQVVALLKFNSNFKECAKWISEKYNLKNVNDYYKAKPKPKEKEKTENELLELLKLSKVDVDVVVDKPPVILEINHSNTRYPDFKRLMTLGNFSAIIGKSKSKKTFLLKKIIATLGANNIDSENKFYANLPDNKRAVLHFDTEQSDYDVWKTAADIHTINGLMENVGHFKLRDKKPKERLKIIEYAVEFFKDNLGVLVIDGVADLVHSINSEEESDNLLHLFMKWTNIYNIHIINILHQNKGNNFATGWLGTQILKKSELVMSVEKIPENPDYSTVACEVIRGAKEFKSFDFYINEDGLPEISNQENINI